MYCSLVAVVAFSRSHSAFRCRAIDSDETEFRRHQFKNSAEHFSLVGLYSLINISQRVTLIKRIFDIDQDNSDCLVNI